MSFRCESCNVAQPDGTRPINKVVLTRPRIYSDLSSAPGEEIVKEINICSTCAGETAPGNAIAKSLNATPLRT